MITPLPDKAEAFVSIATPINRIMHSYKIEPDYDKECRDAWIQFACSYREPGGINNYYFNSCEYADVMLKEFKQRFPREHEEED